MSHDDTNIGPIDTTEEMRQMAERAPHSDAGARDPDCHACQTQNAGYPCQYHYMLNHNRVAFAAPALCDDCLRRKAEDAAKPGVIASGGWCAPSAVLYGMSEMGCHIIEPEPYENFLPLHKKINRKRAIKAFKEWERHQSTVGTMFHGYTSLREFLPEVSVNRGGIRFQQ